MPRMIDLIRASAVPATRMQAAARGALTVPAAEMIEILVHLANHNKIFSQQAKLTLAGWDEASALAVASDPRSSAEVLEYMISPQNLRPPLLPALLENPTVTAESIIQLASSGSRETVETILKSKRCSKSPAIQNALSSNPNLRAAESAALEKMEAQHAEASAAPPASAPAETADASVPVQPAGDSAATAPEAAQAAPEPDHVAPVAESHEAPAEATEASAEPAAGEEAPDPVADQSVATYLTENAAEIAAEAGKPFQPIGGIELLHAEPAATVAEPAAPVNPPAAQASTASAVKTAAKKPHPQPDGKRDNTVQKINKLDVKGRIQLAMKGTKEERSILIRDGTKIVALAVLESPKITDGEVEHFANQKNVLEAVLRAIPMKRRFAKQYGVLRNLVANPRTPLDVSLGLMKHMLVQDLKNLSGNKEISDTVRKLALKMFKQKMDMTKKD
jgi:hypothetical protein